MYPVRRILVLRAIPARHEYFVKEAGHVKRGSRVHKKFISIEDLIDKLKIIALIESGVRDH